MLQYPLALDCPRQARALKCDQVPASIRLCSSVRLPDHATNSVHHSHLLPHRFLEGMLPNVSLSSTAQQFADDIFVADDSMLFENDILERDNAKPAAAKGSSADQDQDHSEGAEQDEGEQDGAEGQGGGQEEGQGGEDGEGAMAEMSDESDAEEQS